MNYTETYRKIYSIMKTDDLTHEQAHSLSLKITNALSELCLITQEKPEVTSAIVSTVDKFAHQHRIGGYDIDDRN